MILIINFMDSYTFNIKNFFISKKHKSKTLNYFKLNKIIIKVLIYRPNLVIGSGPDSPYKYFKIYNFLKIFYSYLYFIGICLGHQIISCFFGSKISISKKIKHGKTSKIYLNEIKINIMIYNSLNVKIRNEFFNFIIKKNYGLMFQKFKNILSFQYHPESYFSYGNKKIFKYFSKYNKIF
ncbi:glutamine amidotransferase-related protein [Candidatus Vidania fulgoroideorum]